MSDSGSGAERVVLRAVESRDIPALFQFQLDPDSNRMAIANPREAEPFRLHWEEILRDASVVARVILLDDQLVGNISCFKLEGLDSVGYWIAKEHWGKGIATRALRLLLDAVALRPLHARAARSNAASIRVLEKCGFRIAGYEWVKATDRFPACEEARLVLD